MRRPCRLLAPLAALALGSACIPLPLAAPPSRVSLTGGGAARGAAPADPGPASGMEKATIFRAELDPLQYTGAPEDRVADAGLGVLVLDLPDSRGTLGTRWGVMLSGRAHPWTQRLQGGAALRLSVGGNLDLMIRDGDYGGVGSTATADFELVWPIEPKGYSDSDNRSGIIGVSAGEFGVAARVEAGYYYLRQGVNVFTVTAGVSVRIPATLALYVISLL